MDAPLDVAPTAAVDAEQSESHSAEQHSHSFESRPAEEHQAAHTETPAKIWHPYGDAMPEPSADHAPEAAPVQHLEAPSIAPEGRTLEHEVLEDEEMEFHPVPDDISALSEVAGDEELVLEEETLDSDNGYSERWIPKIADVDEDEVVAAEERGENI